MMDDLIVAGTVDYQITFREAGSFGSAIRGKFGVYRFDHSVWGDLIEAFGESGGLIFVEIVEVEHMANEITGFESVFINQKQVARAGPRQQFGDGRAKRAGAHQ